MNIAAIMPCRGRPGQTVANVKRLLATAGMPFKLLCVIDGDPSLQEALAIPGTDVIFSTKWSSTPPTERVGYWRSLVAGTEWVLRESTHMQTGEPYITHFVNLANDLLPGQHWLRRAVDAYQEAFPGENDYGLLGFNGDSHEVGHSCHFLIDADLLTYLGGWPTWYDHNFGDTELCQRAIELGFYAKAPWALLYHDHPYWGGRDDAVYAEGRKAVSRDEQLYLERKRVGWPTVPQTL